MDKWENVDDVLEFAISREQAATDFYTDLAGKVKAPGMKELFEQFAREEQGHKKKLQNIKADKALAPAQRQVLDLKIGDYLVDVEPDEDIGLQDALIVAMKREKAAFKLYTDLAGVTTDKGLKETFAMLAQEEAKHKLRFEVMYDDKILTEN